MSYTVTIMDVAEEHGLELEPGDAARIEGFMRLEYGTLDHLGRERLADEARAFLREAERTGRDVWTENARTYGLEVI